MAYVVQMQGSEIQYIRVYSAGILLGKTKLRQYKCVDCTHLLSPEERVYRSAYRANGFLRQTCLTPFLGVSTCVVGGSGDAGLRVNTELGWLVAGTLSPRQFTIAEVLEAIENNPGLRTILE